MTRQPTAEQNALLALLGQPGSAVDRIATTDWQALDWRRILDGVETNIFPVLDYLCDQRGILDAIPAAARQRLAAARQATRLRHLRWASEIRAIDTAMAAADVDCLLLKGADLKFRLYPDPSTRPMSDLDLLIAPERFAQAQAALHQAGFRPRYEPAEETPIASRTKPWEEVMFVKQAGPQCLMLELKCLSEKTPTGFVSDWPSQWQRSRPAAMPGLSAARVLDPADLLVQLSLHLIYHHGCERGLLWLLDIRLLLERWQHEIDWPQLQRRCRTEGSARVVALALFLVERLLGVPACGRFAGDVDAQEAEQLFDLAWEQIFYSRLERRPPYTLTGVFSRGSKRQIAAFAVERIRLWASQEWRTKLGAARLPWWQVPALMARRAWRDLKTYRAAWRHGVINADVVQGYQAMDARSAQMRALLASRQ